MLALTRKKEEDEKGTRIKRDEALDEAYLVSRQSEGGMEHVFLAAPADFWSP